MIKISRDTLVVILIPILFFLASFLTLSHYGISWDEPIHFIRGQAYLNYFLSGDIAYENIKPSDRRSHYQNTSFNAEFFMENDSGHPPLNGIFAALSNYIFYQKLGFLGDIESFHLFNILSATFLILIVVVFAYQAYGFFAALIAGIVMSTYPLFFAEGHFNIKDPVQAAFFGATVWSFWNAFKKLSWKWLLISAIFFAFALSTKFNVLFLPFIIFPWLILRYKKSLIFPLGLVKNWPKEFLVFLVISPLIITAIFFVTWPFLWQDPLQNTLSIFRYYEEIGTGGRGQPNFMLPGRFNIFPVVWIITTTPIQVLLLTLAGIISALLSFRKDKEKTALLWLIWLIVPILRVSVPNSSIYGGVRQIMEFIPAMALLSGLGALTLSLWLKKIFKPFAFSSKVWKIAIIFIFIPHLYTLIKLHPNENVYFNSLIGGLKGAQEKNIPYLGNSFGNGYYQAVKWLNKNAEPNSKLALVQGTMVNVPSLYLRPDIQYSNGFWSGINQEGEYLLELTHEGNQVAYPEAWEYINNVLIPVYEVKADGVVIAKVWKNDAGHSYFKETQK